MQIVDKTLTGLLALRLCCPTPSTMSRPKYRHAPNQQHLIFASKQLEDGRTLNIRPISLSHPFFLTSMPPFPHPWVSSMVPSSVARLPVSITCSLYQYFSYFLCTCFNENCAYSCSTCVHARACNAFFSLATSPEPFSSNTSSYEKRDWTWKSS